MNELIICDLDGTLSDCSHRQHLAASRDWEGFHQTMGLDSPNLNVLSFLKLHCGETSLASLVFLTGRPEEYRKDTEQWLSSKCGLYLDDDFLSLVMRPKNDFSPDTELKLKLLQNSLLSGEIGEWFRRNGMDPMDHQTRVETLLFLEDRDRVAAMWRDNGYACWQVNEGAF